MADNKKVSWIVTIVGLILVGLIIFASVSFSSFSSDSGHLSFSITQASVSSFNISPTDLHANFSLVASLKNPHKNSYDDVHAALSYGTPATFIANTSLESFSMEQDLVQYINLVADKELDPAVASAITRDQVVNGTVGFGLNFSARDRGTTAKWNLGRRTVEGVCQGIFINFGNPSETMGLEQPINCDVLV